MRIRGSAAILAFAALCAIGFLRLGAASASTLKTLFDFCNGAGCDNGSQPSALLMDSSGNLYGTTQHSGAFSSGTVFELSPGTGKRWKYKVLYPFCKQTGCADGAVSQAKLIADAAGDLYGTTSQGGASSKGTAFELMPNATRTKWTFKLLYTFCSDGGSSCTDGSIPVSGLTYAGAASGTPYDGTSPLYGTTVDGGSANPGSGLVYQLVPNGSGATETVLYRFCPKPNCLDGASPEASVVVDAEGNLYGNTAVGGKNGLGTVFELSPTGGNHWTETVLHNFCAKQPCPDGDVPQSEMLFDASGNLYGVASGGKDGEGVAFKLVPNGKTSQETVLHNFCAKTNCTDGGSPLAGLVMDASGDLFGTTTLGGRNNAGAAFELNGHYRVLYNFCAHASCTDGSDPDTTLVIDGSGHLFGTTQGGGSGNGGTVFELSP